MVNILHIPALVINIVLGFDGNRFNIRNMEVVESRIIMAHISPTEINGTEGLDSFLPYISEVTNFWFGRMLMIAIFVIFLMGYLRVKKDDIVGALAVSSYVTFVLGLLFWVIGVVSGLDFAIIIGIVIVASVILLAQKKDF